jgi:hypothetical protein
VCSDSSYDSLQFWKTKTGGNTKVHAVAEADVSGQQRKRERKRELEFVSDSDGDKKEKGKKEDEDGSDDDDQETGTESGTTGKDVLVNVVDDYADIIDQYAGGWRETMFFGEPEE